MVEQPSKKPAEPGFKLGSLLRNVVCLRTTRRYNPVDRTLHIHRRHNIKSKTHLVDNSGKLINVFEM
jgi:hypothetical protein